MNYKKMRRSDRQMDKEQAYTVLDVSEYAILSLSTKDAKPYGVAVSHVLSDNKIYFHCANEGYKLDLIEQNPYVHFFAISKAEIVSKSATVKYASCSVFGKAYIVKDEEERNKAFSLIIDKFMPEFREIGEENVKKHHGRTVIVAVDIDNITGKGNLK